MYDYYSYMLLFFMLLAVRRFILYSVNYGISTPHLPLVGSGDCL